MESVDSRERLTVRGLCSRHAKPLLGAAAMLAALQIALNQVAWVGRRALDLALASDPGLVRSIVLLLIVAVSAFLLRTGSRWLLTLVTVRVEHELRVLLLAKLHTLGPSFFGKKTKGEILSLATEDVSRVGQFCGGVGAMIILNTPFALVSSLHVMLSISPKLTAIQAAPVFIGMFLVPGVMFSTFKLSAEERAGWIELTTVVQRAVAGLRDVIRPLGLERVEERRYAKANEGYYDKAVSYNRRQSLMSPLMTIGSSIGALAVFVFGGSMLQSGKISAGDFLAFWMSGERFAATVIGLGMGVAFLQSGRASLSELDRILAVEPDLPATTPARAVDVVGGDMIVNDLRFAYGERAVLDGISFYLPLRGSMAIVGAVGSGKTTLALLLSGALPVPPGTVFLDGRDIAEQPVHVRRQAAAYAPQDHFLFSTTVQRNVALALDDPDGEAASAAAKEALAHMNVLDEVMALPEREHTVVGERGIQLSGGQRQRLSLARAFLSDAPILILDDPMSAVDTVTEAKILGAIDELRRRRTMILITQRASVASRCDTILFLDAGKVVEHDRPAALMRRKNGRFAAMVREQGSSEAKV